MHRLYTTDVLTSIEIALFLRLGAGADFDARSLIYMHISLKDSESGETVILA